VIAPVWGNFGTIVEDVVITEPAENLTWKVTETMTATLNINDGNLTFTTTADAEAIPNFASYASIPWFDVAQVIVSVVIDNKITGIGDFAFNRCPSLTSITIPNSVTYIGRNVFMNCSKLASITIPNSVTRIGYGAFNGCISLTSVIIPNSMTTIEETTFYDCTNLTSVTIPNSVTIIRNLAFRYCNSLASITIPASVAEIAGDPFPLCYGLKNVTVEWRAPLSIGEYSFYDVERSDVTLHVPTGTKSLYEKANVWKDFGKIVEYSPAGCEPVENQTLKAYTSNGILHITGIQPGDPVRVFNISGQLVYNSISKAEKEQIPLNIPGIYIVAIENRSIKVVVE
jgi:hypothetical protein